MFTKAAALKQLLPAALVLAVVLAWLGPAQPPSAAQFGGGMGLGQQEIVRQLRDTVTALRAYRQGHDHFPQMTQEIDDALKFIFAKVSLSPADPSITPQSLNAY